MSFSSNDSYTYMVEFSTHRKFTKILYSNVSRFASNKMIFKLCNMWSKFRFSCSIKLMLSIYPCSFQNLVRVDYKTHDPDWHALLDLLQMAPNLETLVVANTVSLFNRGIDTFG